MASAKELALFYDIGAWVGNVSSSVCVIFVNKILMQATGFGFRYATTLSAFHYLLCSLTVWIMKNMGYIKNAKLPFADLALFTATADTSIISLNLSLMLNPVGFYQIAKLLIIPFVAMVEKFWLKRVFTNSVVASMVVVVVGVAIVTVTDVTVQSNPLGVTVAAISVVSSGMQQIYCRSMQQKHNLSSHELLSNTAPAQGWSLILMGPFLDRYVVNEWVFDYKFTTAAFICLMVSCICAVGVNVSQFMCLGRFSAISYQVLGHSKTIIVLIGGWAFLGDHISLSQFFGMVLAVLGMILYGVASSRPATVPKTTSKTAEEEDPLLKPKGSGMDPLRNGTDRKMFNN